MARTFSIAVELGGLIPDGVPITVESLPTLAFAVREMAEQAHAQWVAYAQGAPLPSGLVIHNRTGEYARSILLHQTGPFAAEIASTLPYASAIEEGMPKRDMKKMLGYSMKVRVSKAGKRYLIIPFRWNSPNSVLGRAMPEPVYNWWQGEGRERSHITGTFRRVSGTGAFDVATRRLITVPGRRYSWGSRLGKADIEGMGLKGKQAAHMVGMVAFHDPSGSKGSKSGQYLTFRVMSEGSKGWQSPAVPGKWPARTVAQMLQPVAEKAFERAVQLDVERLLGGTRS